MKRNPRVVYSGKVGSKLKPRKSRVRNRTNKRAVVCENGPWAGQTLYISRGTLNTLPLRINGVVGAYKNGFWESKV